MTTPAEDVAAAAELLEPQARAAAAGGAPVPIPPAAALELARWLRAEAQRLTRAALPEWQEVVSPHAAALARAVAAAPRAVEQPAAARCENCGHAPHGHAEHLTDPAALTDCPDCPCAAELRELSGEDQPAVEQPAVPRFLTEAEEEAAYEALRGELGPYAGRVGHLVLTDALTAALAALRIFTPAPEPEPGTCPVQLVDPAGGWHQCESEPGHDPAEGHGNGDWWWPDGQTHADPEPRTDT